MTRVNETARIVYLGPPVYGIKTGTVYTAGLPAELQKLAEAFPSMGILFVPVEMYAEKFRQLSDPGSVIAIAYQKAVDYMSKGGYR